MTIPLMIGFIAGVMLQQMYDYIRSYYGWDDDDFE